MSTTGDVRPTLIVLAAGLGSRFGGPKQIEPFGPGGETLMELNIHDAITEGVRGIVVVTRAPLAARIGKLLERLPPVVHREVVLQEFEAGAQAHAARQRPWGTAHAVLAAGAPEGAALVANADDLYGRQAFRDVVRALSRSAQASAVLAAYRLDRTLTPHGGVSRGICHLDARGVLAKIVEVSDSAFFSSV